MKKILIVEDSKIAQERITSILNSDFKTTIAKDGKEAIEKLKEESFHLVLLDLNMPTMNGWEFLIFLREKGLNIPIIVVTAERNSEKLKVVNDSQQVKEIFHKPIKDNLIDSVKNHVENDIFSLQVKEQTKVESKVVKEVEMIEEVEEIVVEEVEKKVNEISETKKEAERMVEEESALNLNNVIEIELTDALDTSMKEVNKSTIEKANKNKINNDKIIVQLENDVIELKKENKSLLLAISTLTSDLNDKKESLNTMKTNFKKVMNERAELINLIKEFEKERELERKAFQEKEKIYLENSKKKDFILEGLESELTKLIHNEELLQDEILSLKDKLNNPLHDDYLLTKTKEGVFNDKSKETSKKKLGLIEKLPSETITKSVSPTIYEGYSEDEEYSLETVRNEEAEVELLVEKEVDEVELNTEPDSTDEPSLDVHDVDSEIEIVVGSNKESNEDFFRNDSETERDLNHLIESNSNQMDSEVSTLLKSEDNGSDDFENLTIHPPAELDLLSQRREEIRSNSTKYRFSGDNDDIVLFDNEETSKENKPGFFSAIKEVFSKK